MVVVSMAVVCIVSVYVPDNLLYGVGGGETVVFSSPPPPPPPPPPSFTFLLTPALPTPPLPPSVHGDSGKEGGGGRRPVFVMSSHQTFYLTQLGRRPSTTLPDPPPHPTPLLLLQYYN
ncbi:hypothetical protein E2C01_082225 [Portunus trituberculatus]|uniref:Uncharacterized protein n=1 Tax=Portunus trituberculatus TaxID=210409 RepID=A0A5B7J4B5_PORTR|nr:hypothetical protein [Portunus trituberculatus]